MGWGSWIREVEVCKHPRGFDYYWMTGHYRNDEPDATDNDQWALAHGYVTVTPSKIDVTDYEVLDKMKIVGISFKFFDVMKYYLIVW